MELNFLWLNLIDYPWSFHHHKCSRNVHCSQATSISHYEINSLSKKFQDIFTSKIWKLMEIVLLIEAVIIQVQSTFGYSGDAKMREVVFSHSEQYGSIGILLKYAQNPLCTYSSSVMNCIVMYFPVPEIVFFWLLKL